jgi:DNA-binding transcriptional regulator YdaS (Cro superfamily)
MPKQHLRPVRSFDHAVEILGGTTATARVLSRSPSDVCHWRTRGAQFPAQVFPKVLKALKREGFEPSIYLFAFEHDDLVRRAG